MIISTDAVFSISLDYNACWVERFVILCQIAKLWHFSERIRTPITQLRALSNQYLWRGVLVV